MKALLLFTSLIFSSFFVQAQIIRTDTVKANLNYKKSDKKLTQSDFMYSIGLNFFSRQQLPKKLNQLNADDYLNSYFNGAIIKINDNQISYRLSGYYFNGNMSFYNDCINCEIVKGKVTDYSFKIGFEKNLSYSSLQPYFGLDLGYRYNQFKGHADNLGSSSLAPYAVTTQKNSGVFSPFIGLRYNVIDHLSIGAEAGLDIMYSYERQERVPDNNPAGRTIPKYNRWEYLLKPLSIVSLQYNFGALY